MRFSEAFIDELKDRLPISGYIGRKVKLVRSGKNFKGLSPFKDEKTPSFYVDDEKRTYRCFSTQQSGDIIAFVQETEGLSFQEAIEKLAQMAGMELPTENASEKKQVKKRKSLFELMEAAVSFYEAQLRGSNGELARNYLQKKRGLNEGAWARHRIGYAPEGWQTLHDHLVEQGATAKDLLEIGLVRESKQANKPPYDAFRHRIIFPILDPTGRPIALGGRALESAEVLKDKGIPKYVNSSETPLFHKSSVIYNYGRARDAIYKLSRHAGSDDPFARGLIVSEGYMDVIAMAEKGFSTAVAPMGTALTEEQLKMLWRVGPEPIMCFDGDSAGQKAAMRAVDLALPLLEPGKSVFVTLLPQGMDPDDLLKTEGGKEGLRDLLRNARPLVDLLWERELGRESLDTPERIAGFEARLDDAVASIGHEKVRVAYMRELKDRRYQYFRELRFAKKDQRSNNNWGGKKWDGKGNSKYRGKNVAQGPVVKLSDTRGLTGRTGLGMIIRAIDSPNLMIEAKEMLAMAVFSDEDVSTLRNAALDVQEFGEKVDRSAIAAHLRSLGRTRSAKLLEEYPNQEPIDPATVAGREWLAALERFPTVAALKDEADSEKNAFASANGVEEHKAEWARRKRLVAERQALKAKSQELIDDTTTSNSQD
ncbi:DNA primase [Hirschia litorea]|uniref:DNA primase n=1 Tax=Hirschia litorea TaxID=1199156 RepID=A0ABW2IJU4_9PROT